MNRKANGHAFRPVLPPLATYIKKILARYPDGQIMKELLQNAEDAGATELRLVLDLREFNCQSLHSPILAACRGPALLAYNNANFTEEDWENIQSTEQSYKDNEPTKIGRFGIGFNAVYHLTDFPWIVSGTKVGVFDPRETGAFKLEDENGIERVTAGYKWDMDDEEHRAQMQNIPNQFAPLELDFNKRSHKGTLFRFPLRRKETDSKVFLSNATYTKDKILELFKAFTNDGDRLLLFLKSVQKVSLWINNGDGKGPQKFYSVTNECIYPAKLPNPLQEDKTYCEVRVTVESANKAVITTNWAIVHHNPKNVPSAELSKLAEEYKLLPWVGVACPLDVSSVSNDGKISCFLPLPPTDQSCTGLPVEVHGYFCLTDSRQGVLWPSAEQTSDQRTRWNECLVNQVLSSAYLLLLKNVVQRQIERGTGNQLVAHLFPDLSIVSSRNHFRKMAEILYANAMDLKLFWSSITGSFVSASTAVFSTTALPRSVTSVCASANVPLVDVQNTKRIPDYMVQVARVQVKTVSPKFVAELLRRQKNILGGCGPWSADEKRELLAYLLSDRSCSLDGIPLLMLADGSFVAFKPYAGSAETVYVVSKPERQLLPGLDHRFLHESCVELLTSVIYSGSTQLRAFTPQDMPNLLKLSIESGHWKPGQQLQSIWNYIHKNSMTVGYHCYEGLPLLPVATSRNSSATVAKLDSSNKLLTIKGLDAAIVSWLQDELEMLLVDDQPYLKARTLLANYVLDSSVSDSCIEAIYNIWYKNPSRVISSIQKSMHTDTICIWLRKQIQSCTVQKRHFPFLKELPILTAFLGKPSVRISAKDAQMKFFQFQRALDLLHAVGFPRPIVSSEDAFFAKILRMEPMEPSEITKIIIESIGNGFYVDGSRSKALDWISSNYAALPKASLRLLDKAQVLKHLVYTAQKSPIDQKIFTSCCALLKLVTGGRFKELIASRTIFPCRNGTLHDLNTLYVNCSLTSTCPYICEFAPWVKQSGLLDDCEAQINLERDDLLSALNRIHKESSVLDHRQLNAYREILFKLRTLMVEKKIDSQPENFLLPDVSGKLCVASDLSTHQIDTSEDQSVVHRDMPHQLALFFGAKSIDHLQLEQFEFVGEGEFGQEVELVERIKSLLEQYHSEDDLFQEFIQNADDAGATEISFIIDERHHNEFCKVFKTLEGPALLIHNNSTFTNEDVIGIQKLGVGSKAEDREKIGRYGAGFNCAYKYTDCPSFISDDKDLCIFDPLRSISKNYKKCGRRINVSDSFKEIYSPFYNSYKVPSLSLSGGTMFRLPVSIQTICQSTLAQQHRMLLHRQMFSSASKKISQMLLFLKNISTISGYCTDARGKTTQLWQFTSSTTSLSPTSKEDFASEIHRYANYPARKIPASKTCYKLVVEDKLSTAAPQQWIVYQQLGFTKHVTIDFNKIKLLPLAGVATQLPNRAKHQLFCSLPLPQMTDLPVSVNGHFALDSEGRKNLFTPTTGSNDLRQQWNDRILNDIVVSSYCGLLDQLKNLWFSDPPCNQEKTLSKIQSFWNFFPTISTTQHLTHHGHVVMSCREDFVQNFYKALSESGCCLIPCIGSEGQIEWPSFIDCPAGPVFPFPGAWLRNPGRPDLLQETFLLLHKLGMKITPAPEHIQRSFTNSGVSITTASGSVVSKFLCGSNTALPLLPCPVKDTVFKTEDRVRKILRHVTHQTDDAFTLDGLPLLVTADHKLRKFDEGCPMKFEECKISVLFQHHQNLFVSDSQSSTLNQYQKTIQNKKDPCLTELTLQDLVDLLPCELESLGITEKFDSEQSFSEFPAKLQQPWLNTLWLLIARLVLNADALHPFLAAFKNWTLIPAQLQVNGPTVLFKVEMMKQVFLPNLLRCIRMKYPLTGVPVVNTTEYQSLCHSTIEPVFCDASSEKPSRVAQALCFWHDRNQIQWPMDYRQKEIAYGILQYFSTSLGDSLHVLKRLPLFEMFDGSMTAVGDQVAYTLNGEIDKVPSQGKRFWMSQAVFLKTHEVFDDLYRKIGIQAIDVPELYSKYILPGLPMMKAQDQVEHLSYICSKHSWATGFEVVMRILQEVKFIATSDGRKKSMTEFVHHHKLFKEMRPAESFLPENFWDLIKERQDFYNLLQFLFKLGLREEPSANDCIDIATELSNLQLDEENLARIGKVAKMLWQYLSIRSKVEDESWKRCCEVIQSISFIPSVGIDSDLLTLCPVVKNFTKQVLLSTKGRCQAQHTCLLWTVKTTLPDWVNSGNRFLKLMGISDHPSEEDVLQHFSNLFQHIYLEKMKCQADTGLNSPAKRSALKLVLECFYKYLLLGVEENTISRAAKMPLILTEDNRCLAYPDLVVERLPDNIDKGLPPFLFQFPLDLSEYISLFRQLGVKAKPNVSHYAKFLQMVHCYLAVDGLLQDPNVIERVGLAQKEMILLCHRNRDVNWESVNCLYLPGPNEMLLKSTDMVYTSFENLRKYCKLQSSLWPIPYGLLEESTSFIESLPLQLKPKILQTCEQLNQEISKRCQNQKCSHKERLKELLLLPIFMDVLKRLNFAETRKTTLPQGHSWDDISQKLQTIEIQCYDSIKVDTLDMETQQTLHSRETRCWLEDTTLILKHEHVESLDRLFLIQVCLNLKRFIGISTLSELKFETIIHELLQNPCGVEKLLFELDVPPLETFSPDKKPELGTQVSSDLVHFLEMHPLNYYRPGEYVAYLESIYDDPETGFLWAKIVRCTTDIEQSPLTHEYEIDVGDNQLHTVSAQDLYKFILRIKNLQEAGPLVPTDIKPEPEEINRKDVSIEEACQEVRNILTEAWTLDVTERKKILHRLYLAWHPDKNEESKKDFTTEVFKFLQSEIKRLENGLPPEETFDTAHADAAWRSYRSAGTSNSSEWQRYSSRDRSTGDSFNFRTSSGFSGTTQDIPDKQTAQQYWSQAEHDRDAAQSGDNIGSEHTIFLAQQAVEKALKAVLFRKIGSADRTHDLMSLVRLISDKFACPDEVVILVQSFETECHPNCSWLRYPHYGTPPHQRYSREQANKAIHFATTIMEKLKCAV